MAGENAALQDIAISHAIGLRRLSFGVANDVVGLLNASEADLIARIEKLDPTSVAARYTRDRLNRLLADIRVINKGVYGNINTVLKQDLPEIAKYETEYLASSTAKTVGMSVGEFNLPTKQVLVAAATSEPFNGRLLKEWVDGLEAGRFDRLRSAIRIGVVQGEGIDDIVKRVRGTAALNYKDGILETSRRSATAMVRTAVGHVANEARMASYEENSDLLDGWRFVATLDAATCPECAAYDGEEYAVGEGPSIPIHIQCRCTSMPLVKGGGQAGTPTYGSWLKDQPPAVQDEALGPTRAALFREGNLSIDKFVDDLGRPLTLDQLREIEPRAFDRAGLMPDVRAVFVSPNVGNLDFAGAVEELSSTRQSALRSASKEIDQQLGIRSRDSNIIGAWADGAENSVMSAVSLGGGTLDERWERLKLSAAMKGHLADQKQVLIFQQKEGGTSVLYKFDATGDLKDIHQNLLDDGLPFHTLVPTDKGAKVIVADLDGSAYDAVNRGAERYGTKFEYQTGRAEFIGTEAQVGTDREQRDAARRAYEEIIGQSQSSEVQGVLGRAYDSWGEALGVTPPDGQFLGLATPATDKVTGADFMYDVTKFAHEGATGWLTPRGEVFDFNQSLAHADAARKVGTTMDAIYEEGAARIYVVPGDMLGIEIHKPPSAQQISELMKIAREGQFDSFAIEGGAAFQGPVSPAVVRNTISSQFPEMNLVPSGETTQGIVFLPPKPGEKTYAMFSPDQMDALNKHATVLSTDMSYPAKRVEVSNKVRSFELDGVERLAGAETDPSGLITMYPRVTGPSGMKQTLAHEVEHQKVYNYFADYEQERAALYNELNTVAPFKLTEEGLLPENYAAEFPLYQEYSKVVDANLNELITKDGITSYSTAWWDAFHAGKADLDIAMHETLAEMARVEATGSNLAEVPQVWRDVYKSVNKNWEAFHVD